MINEFKSGLSRRSFMRTLGAASVAASSFPAFAALQQTPAGRGGAGGGGGDFGGSSDPDMVKISSNENPLGPSAAAREAIARVGAEGGRYNQQYKSEVVTTISQQFGLKVPAGGGGRQMAMTPPPSSAANTGSAPATAMAGQRGRSQAYVEFYPGSGGALDLAVYSNVGPGKDLVVGSPSYNQGQDAGKKMKANVHLTPLTPTGAHDVKAMLAASPNPGAYYICNPNNPMGTMTPKADIVWLVNNKPAGSVVIIDEAYHHFSPDESSIDLVAADKDVIVLRTFSKVYGMAGLRGGFMFAKPELQAKIATIGVAAGTGTGAGAVAISTAAACTASLKDAALVPARRKINADIRANVLEWMDKNGYDYFKGSQANFFQVNVKRPGREFSSNMLKEKVQIGRTWVEMPNYCRITVGTQAEMDKFKVAFKKCYEMAPMAQSAYLDMPFHENPSEMYRHLSA